MLKYYPLTRIKPNLYTRGTTYKLANGKPYVGRYYLTYKGEAFTGANPVLGTNQPLIRIDSPLLNESLTLSNANLSYTVTKLVNASSQKELDQVLNNQQLTDIKPYYPIPLASDYQLGYFYRYFAKIVTGPGYIFEISQTDYANIQNNLLPANFRVYETTSMLWQLTGPLNDTRVSQYQIKGGIINTNRRVTEQKALTFKGLVEFIGGEYTKFAKPTT